MADDADDAILRLQLQYQATQKSKRDRTARREYPLDSIVRFAEKRRVGKNGMSLLEATTKSGKTDIVQMKGLLLLLLASCLLVFGAAGLLWWRYGAAIFSSIIAGAMNLCF